MKRTITLLAAMALVASGLHMIPASAAEGAGPELKLFLHSTGCSKADVNFDYLSIVDADNDVECFYTGSGIRNEIGATAATPATADRATATRYWDTTDSGPVSLDASRPVTGKVFTSGAQCPVSGACSPAGLGAGEVILDITLVGVSGGNEVELGAQTEKFTATPGAPRATEVKIQPDAALSGTYETIELRTWLHGKSAGHGVVKTNGDASSFISIPTSGGKPAKPVKPTKPTKPAKPETPVKNGCDNGKGKKKGCTKTPPSKACAPFTPGEMGKDAKTTVVTDAATEDKPIEIDVPLGPATGTVGSDRTTRMKHNVQVDSTNSDVGLFARLEGPALDDPDLYVYWPSGSQAAVAGGFNPLLAAGPLPEVHPIFTALNGKGSGGHSEFTAEQIDGLRTSDCQGWTLDLVNWAGRGGYTLTLWLGEVQNEPAAEE